MSKTLASKAIPLGEAESQTREFKRAEALKDPAIIARAVVAMLNAKGGQVWVGIEESQGRAVTVQGIESPERERRALWDYFLETIEPAPNAEEVRLEPIEDLSKRVVFRITSNPDPHRGPYAHLKKGGRYFVRRVGDRIRPMTREEILGEGATSTRERDQDLNRAKEILRKDRDDHQKRGGEVFWLRIQPVPPLDLDLHDEFLKECLRDPERTSNRRMGWVFASPYQVPEFKKDKLVLESTGLVNGLRVPKRTEVHRKGAILLTAPFEIFEWRQTKGGFYPYVLLELPTSLFRFASTLYKRVKASDLKSVLADLALFGVRGRTLRPHSPKTIEYELSPGATYKDEDDKNLDLQWDEPLVFQPQEILETPDRCAFRLIRRVYEAFGYGEDSMPHEFDRDSGRLILPQ